MKEFRKIVYFFMSLKERHLTSRLSKTLKSNFTNTTSKTILSSTETMTITAETEKNKSLVEKTVSDILKNADKKPEVLLDYIKAHGTTVVTLPNADFWLSLIGEDLGLVCEQKGVKAIYINLITGAPLTFASEPVFVLTQAPIDFYAMLHQFHKWCSYKMNLPGFDAAAQKNFKKSLRSKNFEETNSLSFEEIISLKEAVARDQEATAFVLKAMNKSEGSKKAFGKVTSEGSANI